MQHTLLGYEGYRRGMDLYFARHDGQAVTIDDFVAAMEDANKVDFTQFKRWYSQAGTPRVQVRKEYVNGTLKLILRHHVLQHRMPREKTFSYSFAHGFI